ncbi:Spc97_Spc98 domain-containing protein [Cephalotus follicularis]|uniref:Spc97_Spc98 domain-containing protein n=1 Tax=Cephalotus follicularis TaxID=3775 RepID=A0A1Q3C3T8_CEPFO|nr:Spc97_Spc98 domain-containing protein [Cephalotus follicularis]
MQMAVDTKFESLKERVKVEDPWLPPTNWESIPSESGSFSHSHFPSAKFAASSSVSEASLVRLALNALQGVQSALISIQKLSAAFCTNPADRTFHQIPTLWNRSSSTHALGNILNPIGCSGFSVFTLSKFVDYYTNFKFDEFPENGKHSLVNQAFAVALGKVLEGYIGALDTLYASVGLRRPLTGIEHVSSRVGCLTSVVHSEITLLEVYLHTKELRTQIEVLGNICNLHNVAHCFLAYAFDDLTAKVTLEISNFFKGGDLLTYLYTQLQVADPAHRALLKFLFLRSCEPYCGFIRSWIFKAEINDPYKEFVVEYVDNRPPCSDDKASISVDFPSTNFREREGAHVPCFLKDLLIPLVRAGQQLQVLMKLLEFCKYVTLGNHSYLDFLPSWSGFSSNQLFYASPITFSKGNMETLVLARNIYYTRMQEKLENFITELEFSYQQVAPSGALPFFFCNGGGNLHTAVSLTMDDWLVGHSSADKGGSNSLRATGNMDSDESTTEDDCCYQVDISESSVSSVSSSSEEQTEIEHLVDSPNTIVLEEKYLSALSFSTSDPINISSLEPLQSEKSQLMESDLHELYEKRNVLALISNHERKNLSNTFVSLGAKQSEVTFISHVHYMDRLSENAWPLGGLLKNPFCVDGRYRDDVKLHPSDFGMKSSCNDLESLQDFRKTIDSNNSLIEEAAVKYQVESGTNNASNLLTLNLCKINNDYNFLSVNPMLTKNAFSHLTRKPGEIWPTGRGQALPCFDFSFVEDPCKVYVEKLCGYEVPLCEDSNAFATGDKSNHHGQQGFDGDYVLIDDTKESDLDLIPSLEEHSKAGVLSMYVPGGSSWESLLGSSSNTENNIVGNHRQSMSSVFEIPLDFIIDKCLLQEILLQYKYISKLTIKLLEEGFDLQTHLLALRRYHFMEVADWADLFILSLWNHKWYMTEAYQRITEIQGFLELSVQRSSCERDHNKERLFVYMKGQSTVPLLTSAIGVHSFDFLGLGYQVDWPISIVLTPGALKMYAEIFCFLIKVKLAVFSLNDVWCSLKDSMHLIHQNRHSTRQEEEMSQLNVLMKTRHRVYHFVSTLQQYVQSQLSHVSWCRFLHSLKHKVKDMMDLEAVHLAYLIDSLHICFLSDETRSVASIIEGFLECALDFRSCLQRSLWVGGLQQGDMLGKISIINMSQVLAIKQKFEKNLKELHLCYLQSPKQAEFGLSRFWGYLNYNEYYSDFSR